MKIDTHQHYWRFQQEHFPWISAAMSELRRDRLPQDVQPALQAAGVDGVVAVQARSLEAETDDLLQLAAHNPQVLGVVGWTDLRSSGLTDRLDSLAGKQLLKGFRHILQDEPQLGALLRDAAFNQGVRTLQQRGLVYDVLVFDHQMAAAVDFCKQHNRHWLVLDHAGKPAIRDWASRKEVPSRWLASMRALASMPHVVCKLSGLVTETDWALAASLMPEHKKIILECFDRALELFGPNRILFGSDWPVCQLAAPYEVVHGLAQRWASTRLTQQEQNAFWAGNAQRCYALASRNTATG